MCLSSCLRDRATRTVGRKLWAHRRQKGRGGESSAAHKNLAYAREEKEEEKEREREEGREGRRAAAPKNHPRQSANRLCCSIAPPPWPEIIHARVRVFVRARRLPRERGRVFGTIPKYVQPRFYFRRPHRDRSREGNRRRSRCTAAVVGTGESFGGCTKSIGRYTI